MNRKTSPVYIAVFLYRFAFLLITVPLQAVIFEGKSPQIAVFLYRSDIILIIFLAIWAVMCYRRVSYSTSKNALQCRKGVIISQNNSIFTKNFDCLHMTQGIIFRTLKVCKVQTTASKNKTTLYLSSKDSLILRENFGSSESDKPKAFRSAFFSVLLFSAGFSGALTGLLSTIPLLRNIAGIIGERQAQSLLANADLWEYVGYTALPPFLRTLSTLFLLFWAVGAISEFLQHFNLKTALCKDIIVTTHGLITKHQTVLRKNAVSALVLRQSIFLALAGVFTAEAYIPANNRQSKTPLLLASRKKSCKALISSPDFPQGTENSEHIKPPANALWGYVWKPMLFLALCSAFCIGTDLFFPYKAEIHLALFLLIWGSIRFLFCAVCHRRAYLSIEPTGLIISTSKALSFTEIHIPSDKIRAVKVTQNIFQKRKGVCNLYIYIRSDRRQSFCIKHIDKNKTAQLT